ncbi:MAG: peptide-binding protein [Candidatus Marinimicrobia bacterium]|nr:peptide-binding protein [Candidatus Neomarinimicrobiota bacterium]MCF7839281.1 peptide-binding protein [Candidatus Neomarinimicrobiota bacterium]MCF7903100.1 peptide-binding protein [Candidatus Neomarinimicrobiota bacterium]
MKRSILIQLAVLLLLILFTNLIHTESPGNYDEILGQAGGLKVDLTGDVKIFNSSPTDETPRRGGTLIKAESAEPENLNYYTSTSAAAKRFLDYIYEPLVNYDYTTWEYDRPILAKSFEISEDQKTYTFHLHENITWHDGKPLTSEDVLFSLKAIMNPYVDDAPLRAYYRNVVEARTPDKYTFIIRTSDTYFLNLEFMGGFAILPKHQWDPDGMLDRFGIEDLKNPQVFTNESDIKEWADTFNTNPLNRPAGMDAEKLIGSGAYKFHRWITGEYMMMVRNKNYWNTEKPHIPGFAEAAGYLDTIIVKSISDATAMLTALKAGDVDFLPRMRAIQYFEQTNTPDFLQKFQKVTFVVPAYSYVGWNNDRPYFRDKRVRQAMTMLIDRDAYNKYIGYDLGIPTIGPFYPFSPQYNDTIPRWPYDPERAVELLDEAGWTDHDGDGIRDKDGVPFKFIFSVSAGSRGSKLLALMMKEDLQKIGIVVGIRQLEWSVYVENLRDRQFDCVMLLWIGGLQSDPYQIWHSENIGNRGSNYIGFRDAEADSLIMAARYEMNAAKRDSMYRRFQEILHEEQPYTFMFYQRDPGAYDRAFKDVKWIPIRPGYNNVSWWRSSNEAQVGMAP